VIRALKVLGLDLKPAGSGIARTHDSDGELRRSVARIGRSLPSVYDQIDIVEYAVRKACDAEPDIAAIEGTFSRPGASDYGQHAIHFAITRALRKRKVPWVDIAPATLKVWATGKGDATKRDMCAAVVATYGRFLHINPNDDDSCDAVALLSMALAAYGQPLAEVPESQRRALKVPKWPTLGAS
jgi:crossover junction endodeoxyribonuclease RuvC